MNFANAIKNPYGKRRRRRRASAARVLDSSLCAQCQKRGPLPHRTRCKPCRDQQRARGAALRAERRRLKLCLACGHPRKRGIAVVTKRPYAHCSRCLRNYSHWSKAWLARHPRPVVRGRRPPVPVYKQITLALRITGPATGKEIAENLALHRDSVYVQLARMKQKGLLRKVTDKLWDVVGGAS